MEKETTTTSPIETPEKQTESEFDEARMKIDNATNWDELYEALREIGDKFGELKDGNKSYTADSIISILDSLRDLANQLLPQVSRTKHLIPDILGLRSKAYTFLTEDAERSVDRSI